MACGRGEVVRERLAPWFDEVHVEHRDLPWNFTSVQEGMDLYLNGSPTHAWMLDAGGERREALLEALQQHLTEHADTDGRVHSTAGYAVVTAIRPTA